ELSADLDQQRSQRRSDRANQLGEPARRADDERDGRTAGDTYGRLSMPGRTRDYAAAINRGGRRDFADRAATRSRRIGDGAALLRRYGCDRIRNRAAARQEPSRARR